MPATLGLRSGSSMTHSRPTSFEALVNALADSSAPRGVARCLLTTVLQRLQTGAGVVRLAPDHLHLGELQVSVGQAESAWPGREAAPVSAFGRTIGEIAVRLPDAGHYGDAEKSFLRGAGALWSQ